MAKRDRTRDYIFTRDFVYIDNVDLCVLTHNYMKGLEDPQMGHLHAQAPVNRFLTRNRKPIRIRTADLESFLSTSNFLQEEGKFFHWEGLNFDEFIKRLAKEGVIFDKTYNYFTKIDEE